MNESSQAIVAVKREVQLSEWQRQVQARQEQGIPVDEWCASLGISTSTSRMRKQSCDHGKTCTPAHNRFRKQLIFQRNTS